MNKPEYVSADAAAALIKSGDHVFIQGSTSIPETLVAAMARRGGELRDVTVYVAFAVAKGEAPYCRPEFRESFLVDSFFVSNSVRRWIGEGYGSVIPRFLGEVPSLFRQGICPVDVALINCSMPDADGYVSFGVSADLATSAVECAKTVIAQINPSMPFSYGDPVIHISRLAATVAVDDPLVEVPTPEPTPDEIAIGNHIAEHIPDGATLQIGVGGIPNAVLRALHNHKHLGLHTEAMTDGVLPLLEKGIIDNSLKKDIKVASEDSGAEVFRELFKKDRDFYNFVMDEDRMQSYFVSDKYKFKGYREVRQVLEKMKQGDYTPTADELQIVYRMFNYVIPYDGAGDARKGKDVTTQRTKFFNACKEAGYGAVLDTNDAIYGGFKAKSPVIVFDMEQVVPKDVYRTKMIDQKFSDLVLVGRKLLGQ